MCHQVTPLVIDYINRVQYQNQGVDIGFNCVHSRIPNFSHMLICIATTNSLYEIILSQGYLLCSSSLDSHTHLPLTILYLFCIITECKLYAYFMIFNHFSFNSEN